MQLSSTFCLKKFISTGDRNYLSLFKLWKKREGGDNYYEKVVDEPILLSEDDCESCKI